MSPFDALAVLMILAIFAAGVVTTFTRAKPDAMQRIFGDVPNVPVEAEHPHHVPVDNS